MTTRIITVRQPWAWLIIHGGKDIENRSWLPSYTGTLVIHAGKAIDDAGVEFAEADMGIKLPNPMPRGVILGTVELVGAVTDSKSPWAEWGQFHWILKDPRPCPQIPWRGSLGLKKFPDDWQEIYG
jgi:hypothetical protein